MANSLSPGFARISYTGPTGLHHAIVPINLKDGWVQGEEPTIFQKDGTEVPAVTGIGTYITAYAGIFDDGTDFGLVEIYAVDDETEERTFIFAFNSTESGSNVLGAVQYALSTMSFKTTKGGLIRQSAMECVFPVNQKFYAPYTGIADLLAFANYVVSANSIVFGRDGSYAFAPIATTIKTSDALRERAGL